MLQAGSPAPSLSGPTDEGAFNLADHQGKPVVVFFYPKDMTPGCTTEACEFRDRVPEIPGAVVVGVSRDSVKRHANFRAKHDLNFPLVSDEDGTITEAWGVWREKKNYGRTYMGIVRSTFLIDSQGKIAKAWDNVRVKGHVAKVIEALEELT